MLNLSILCLNQANIFLGGQISAIFCQKIRFVAGMVGLTENPDALRKCVVAASELAATIDKFESEIFKSFDEIDSKDFYHRETAHSARKFSSDVQKLVEVIDGLGNPFDEESEDLYNIDTSKVASQEVKNTVRSIEEAGKSQFLQFVQERLSTAGSKRWSDSIKMNKFPPFGTAVHGPSKSKTKEVAMKSDRALFSKLFISTRTPNRRPRHLFSPRK